MAYWDIVYECIREVDNSILRIYVNTYDYEENEILVFDDWNSQKEFAKMLKQRMENIPEVKQDVEDTIYDVSDREDWWVEEAVGGYEFWTFSDEGFVCDECQKWHYYNTNGACSYANYQAGDGYIICEECILSCKENMEEYIREMINNPKNANTILDYGNFLDLDFELVNDYPYAEGWYGRHADPKTIMEKAKAMFPDSEFVFSIRKNYNPFETEFDLYRRKIA